MSTQDLTAAALAASEESRSYLLEALLLAEQGLYTTDPNPRVGCVIVQAGEVVGRGAHWQAGTPHAEIHALAEAGERAKGADVYVTLEPCSHFGRTPPCADALIGAGVGRVIVGMQDPNPLVAGQGIARLRAAGITVAVLQAGNTQASSLTADEGSDEEDVSRSRARRADAAQLLQAIKALNAGYIHRLQQGRPLVRLKLACSLDGRTAMSSGESQWITGPEARADVHRLRARSSAIVTGINTVLKDNAKLTVRPDAHDLAYPSLSDFPFLDFPFAQKVRQPLRVVLDSQFQLSPDHVMCQQPGQTIAMGLGAGPETAFETGLGAATGSDEGLASVDLLSLDSEVLAEQSFLRVGVPADHAVPPGQPARVSLIAALAGLGRLGVNEVLVEAGPTLAGAFAAANLVDELWLYQAPKLLGHEGMPLVQLNLTRLVQAPQWQFMSVTAFGEDMRYILVPAAPNALAG